MKKDNIIEEMLEDCNIDIHHHLIKIVINETTGKAGAVCDGCCAKKVTHPFEGDSFNLNKVVPSIT